MRPVTTAVIALIASYVLCGSAQAHEIGKTQVSATFEHGSYQLDIVVDPDALLTRLQILSTGQPTTPSSRERRDREIAALEGIFLGAVRVNFDGERVSPRFAYRPVSAFSDSVQAPSVVR